MSAARPDPASVLHPAADRPEERQPAHHRLLPRHAGGCCCALRRTGPARRRPSSSLAQLDAPMIGAFLDHLEHERGATASPAATPGSPRSTRCSGSPRSATPSTRRSSAACSPSRPNAASAPWSCFLPPTRSTRCSPARTARAGPAAATTPCSCSPSRPACASPSSPACASGTWSSATAPTCAAPGKAERTGPPRLPARPPPCCASGSQNGTASPTTRCSRPAGSRAQQRRRPAARRTARSRQRTACPSLGAKHVSPHALRHTCAMRMLECGIDLAIIALWLGHEKISDQPNLPARRHGAQGTGARPHHAAGHHPRTLQARRQPPRFP